MGQFHILIEQRVVIADHQHVIVLPYTIQEPGIVQIGQIVQRAVKVGVLVVVAVQEAPRNIERAGHADSVGHHVRMAQREVDGVIAAKAAAGGAHLRSQLVRLRTNGATSRTR